MRWWLDHDSHHAPTCIGCLPWWIFVKKQNTTFIEINKRLRWQSDLLSMEEAHFPSPLLQLLGRMFFYPGSSGKLREVETHLSSQKRVIKNHKGTDRSHMSKSWYFAKVRGPQRAKGWREYMGSCVKWNSVGHGQTWVRQVQTELTPWEELSTGTQKMSCEPQSLPFTWWGRKDSVNPAKDHKCIAYWVQGKPRQLRKALAQVYKIFKTWLGL